MRLRRWVGSAADDNRDTLRFSSGRAFRLPVTCTFREKTRAWHSAREVPALQEKKSGRQTIAREHPCRCVACACARRQILKGALGLAFALPLVGTGSAEEAESRSLRPKAGDRLVFAAGDRKGAVIAPADLQLGGPQVLAYPQDAKSSVIRDGSRLNLVAVVRFDPEELSEETLADAADGVVAYSAVCTHQGCPVSMWQDKGQTLFCSCHASEFDPRNGAEVVAGPAPRRLAALPLKAVDDVLIVAAEFSGRVGFKR